MATIYCPNCGSPVMLRGDGWECGWCGDFGDISSLSRPEREKLRAELAADVYDRGTVMTGGGSLLSGLDALIEEKTGINTVIAEEPLTAVAIGTGKFIEFMHGQRDPE